MFRQVFVYGLLLGLGISASAASHEQSLEVFWKTVNTADFHSSEQLGNIDHLQATETWAIARGDMETAIMAKAAMATLALYQGQFDEAELYLYESRNLIEAEALDIPELHRVAVHLAFERRDYVGAAVEAEQAIAGFIASGDEIGQAWAMTFLAFAQIQTGEWEAALGAIEEAQDIAFIHQHRALYLAAKINSAALHNKPLDWNGFGTEIGVPLKLFVDITEETLQQPTPGTDNDTEVFNTNGAVLNNGYGAPTTQRLSGIDPPDLPPINPTPSNPSSGSGSGSSGSGTGS